MKKFLGLTKPSEALEAMVKGLLRADRRKTFKVDMRTFGKVNEDGICYGCAATCTLQEAGHHNFKPSEISFEKTRADALGGASIRDLDSFECFMDDARRGHFGTLFYFFGYEYNFEYNNRFYLDNDNWKEEIPEVRKVIREMKKAGY